MVLVAVITLLALFSIVSIVMSAEDPTSSLDPRDNPYNWSSFGHR
jgi:hypothetical protein